MKKLCAVALFIFLAAPAVWADTQETTVFKAAMSPDNEIPAVSAPGFSGFATITVRVTRDGTGNINAATVVFDIDYTIPVATTVTGLHIHNAIPGTSGSVVINTGLSGSNSLSLNGTGHITKLVNYASTDTAGLGWVTGLLDVPENYYVNIHSTVQPNGFMRAPLPKTSIILRPAMNPAQEVPAVTGLDAEGAAAIQVRVNRNAVGVITSGSVVFDVDYRLPANSIITGLNLANAAAGATGPVVFDSGINATTRAITPTITGRGNIFRIVDIDSSNVSGLAMLDQLMRDPRPLCVNLLTAANPTGAIRGQFSTDTYAFFGQMIAAEETPPTPSTGVANTMTIVRVSRDTTGNITSGTVSFNVAYSGLGPVTFTGLHIHNGPLGVQAAVVINTGLNGTNTIVDATGNGSVNRDVIVDGTSASVLNAMKGVLANPEMYYVNIHTTVFPNGIIRSQLGREVYHFKAPMSPANEVPAVTSATSATGWVTAKVSRDVAGVINGGEVTFDIDVNGTGVATTYTGLHIHSGSAIVAGPVVINTGLSASNPVNSTTGTLNITRVVSIAATDTANIAMLGTLINNPDQAYVNIHTTVNPGGVARSQMLPVVNYVPQAAGGGDWISSITITNPSTSSSVHGVVDTFQNNGSPMSTAIVDPNLSFLIPPGGSATVNLHNKGTLTSGFSRVYSSGTVTVSAAYNFPAFPATAVMTPAAPGRLVSIPVTVGAGANTGVAILAVTPGTLILTLRDAFIGAPIAGGTRSIDVTASQQLVGFVRDLLPGVTQAAFSGTLQVESFPTIGAGQMSAIALQFDTALSSVPVTVIP